MSEALPRAERGHEWLGAHFFFDGGLYSEVCDRVVLEVVAPLVEELAGQSRRWFFIRYNEGGSHVRLRIFAPPAHLAAVVRPAIEGAATDAPLVRRLEFVAYTPEVERYGGPDGVVLAEELFHHASTAALALLAKAGAGDRAAKSGKAVLALLVQLHAFFDRPETAVEAAGRYGKIYLRAQVRDPRQRARWLEAFGEGYERQGNHLAESIVAVWETLAAGDGLSAELDLYHERMQQMAIALRRLALEGRLLLGGEVVCGWPVARGEIAASYFHMMNNRLGVSLREECYLSLLVHRFLGRIAQESSEAIPLRNVTKGKER